MVEETLLKERFEGITKYRLGVNMPIERTTCWCSTLDEVMDALENQKKHFEKEGAKIISQRIRRERVTEFYTLGC